MKTGKSIKYRLNHVYYRYPPLDYSQIKLSYDVERNTMRGWHQRIIKIDHIQLFSHIHRFGIAWRLDNTVISTLI